MSLCATEQESSCMTRAEKPLTMGENIVYLLTGTGTTSVDYGRDDPARLPFLFFVLLYRLEWLESTLHS